jgi:N utilization substance protein A
MKSEFEIAITQLSSDRNLAPEVILEAIEAALVSAYKRNYGASQAVNVTIHPRTGQAQVFVTKEVVEEVENEEDHISLAEARTHKADAQIGDLIEVEVMPRNFGRIAAQTAKQVITQRIREAERDSVYLEYADRVGELVNGVVRNVDGRTHNVTISMGKAEASLPRSEQIPGEHYRFGQRLRVYIVETERSGHGPQITVSRTHRDLLRRLLELEVPEIYNGTVEIKAIAREPGSRSKVAVSALQPGVDPVGSCVGMRGVRIQNIVNELNGEKIDVVAWSPDMTVFIANALSPAKVVTVDLSEKDKTARVVVPDRSLSLAIGKEGQNARLAAKLTNWRIDIKSEAEAAEDAERMVQEREDAARRAEELEQARKAAAELLAAAEVGLDEEDLALEEESLSPEYDLDLTTMTTEVESVEAPEVDAEPTEVVDAYHTEPVETAPVAYDEEEADEPAATESVAEAANLEPEPVLDEASVAEEVSVAGEEIELYQEPQAVEGELAAELDENGDESEDADLGDAEEDVIEEDVEEEDGDIDRKSPKKGRRDRRLEFDERLGQVVARKQHKNAQNRNWKEALDEDDWDEDL